MPRLLALDGGGAWALLQVRALMELYGADATGYTVLRDFDLVTATSGGSIVAGALAANWPLQKILDLFHSATARKSIFVKLRWNQRIFNSVLGVGPK